MLRSDFYKRFLLVVAILMGIAGVGSYTVSADSTESGSAVVTFTHPTLNPSDPRLPLADSNGEGAGSGTTSGKGNQAVVVDTTPEKTKVTTTSTKRQSLPNTSTRQTLPQTGTETMPIIFVLTSIALGLMMGWQVLTNGRKLAK